MGNKKNSRTITMFMRILRLAGSACLASGMMSLLASMLFSTLYAFGVSESIGAFSYMLLCITFILFLCESFVERYISRKFIK